MHHLKLHQAIDPEGQSVLATEAINQNEDTYFCPSCGCAVILRPHSPQKAWFEHDKREVAGTIQYCIYLAQAEVQAGSFPYYQGITAQS